MWYEHALKLPSTVVAARRAASTTSRVGEMPFLIVHYEDYQDRFNETASRLMEFLELEGVEPPSLEPFRPDQVEAIRDFISHLASDELWDILRRNF
jgi:hypothetical protein